MPAGGAILSGSSVLPEKRGAADPSTRMQPGIRGRLRFWRGTLLHMHGTQQPSEALLLSAQTQISSCASEKLHCRKSASGPHPSTAKAADLKLYLRRAKLLLHGPHSVRGRANTLRARHSAPGGEPGISGSALLYGSLAFQLRRAKLLLYGCPEG